MSDSEPDHVAPGQRDDDAERAGDDEAISRQRRFQAAVGHWLRISSLAQRALAGMDHDWFDQRIGA
jgi:hypothetical protein